MIPEAEFEGFRIDEVLSRSSTTNVYRAFQYSLKRSVLIKELRPELFVEDDLRARFEREAQVCAHIKHENIVDIYHYSAERDRIYLVMEFVDGCSLADLLQSYPTPPLDLSYAMMVQTLKGLSYAHSREVVHRDLKPSNILISRNGWVKVTDFGLALFEGSPHITQPGAVVGTPAYLSPEAISGGSITPGSDIFSLGVTFYQLLTSQKIYYAEHFSDSLNKVLSYNPPKPSQYRSEIPPPLDHIILRMLEKQPAKRWVRCDEILAEIEKVAQLDDPRKPILRFWESPPQAEPPPEERARQEPTPPIRRKRPTLLWASLIAIFIVVAAYGVFSITKDRSSEPVFPAERETIGTVPEDDTTHQQPSLAEKPDTLPRPIRSPFGIGEVMVEARKPEGEETITEEAEPEPMASLEPSEMKPDSIPSRDTSRTELLTDLILPRTPVQLVVRCDPWADVYVDGILVGKTPFESVQIEPGEHRLVFRHPNFAPVVRDVTVRPGERLNLKVDFWETVGRLVVLADPWAEVYVDGDYVDVTPLREPLIVPLGVHTVTLKNPAVPSWEKEITFRRGEPPCTLKVELKPTDG